jgi:hypothetical protein
MAFVFEVISFLHWSTLGLNPFEGSVGSETVWTPNMSRVILIEGYLSGVNLINREIPYWWLKYLKQE